MPNKTEDSFTNSCRIHGKDDCMKTAELHLYIMRATMLNFEYHFLKCKDGQIALSLFTKDVNCQLSAQNLEFTEQFEFIPLLKAVSLWLIFVQISVYSGIEPLDFKSKPNFKKVLCLRLFSAIHVIFAGFKDELPTEQSTILHQRFWRYIWFKTHHVINRYHTQFETLSIDHLQITALIIFVFSRF